MVNTSKWIIIPRETQSEKHARIQRLKCSWRDDNNIIVRNGKNYRRTDNGTLKLVCEVPWCVNVRKQGGKCNKHARMYSCCTKENCDNLMGLGTHLVQ